jgi:hypothetical protein
MNNEIILSVAYDDFDDFQHVNFGISQIFISLFWALFNDKTNLKVRHIMLVRIARILNIKII